MVIDTLNARNGTTDMPIDSYDNKMIDEIVYEGQSFHFAKQKNLTGTSEIVADNGVVEPIISLGVSGNTSQKSYGGYNLLNKEEFLVSYLRNETAYSGYGSLCLNTEQVQKMLKPNTKYTISYDVEGIEDLSNVESLMNGCGFMLWNAGTTVNRTMRAYGYPKAIGEIVHADFTITTPSDLVGWHMRSYQYNLTIDGQTGFHACILRNVQIVEGAEEKPYEPYVGGIPSPNPQYPQEIENANNGGMGITLHGDNFREEIAIPQSVEVEGETVELNMASASMTDTNGTYTATDYLTVDKLSNKVIYHQNVEKRTVTSDMNIVTYVTNGFRVFILRDTNAKRLNNPILANKYLGYRTVGVLKNKDYGITTDAVYWGVSSSRITIRDTRFETLADFKADLDQNPLIIECGLVEEITHDITNTDLGQSLLALATGKGTNYLEITSNLEPSQTEFSYWRQIIPNE